MNINKWVPLFQTILWVVFILGFIIIYRKMVGDFIRILIRKVELSKNLKIGPVVLESSIKSLLPDSPCHKKVLGDWKNWIEKKEINGDISGVFSAIIQFQKTILEKGCGGYEYALDLKDFGRFCTKVVKEKTDKTSIGQNDKEMDIESTLELDDQIIHKSWKARKLDNNEWEINLII